MQKAEQQIFIEVMFIMIALPEIAMVGGGGADGIFNNYKPEKSYISGSQPSLSVNNSLI